MILSKSKVQKIELLNKRDMLPQEAIGIED